MAVCAYCQKSKGKRSCPALGGLICPRCCGEHRMIRIACPQDCRYLSDHEGYQRERTAEAFASARMRLIEQLDRKTAPLLTIVEAIIYRHCARQSNALDGEVIAGLEDLRRRLSPLAVPESTHTPFGSVLWKDLEPFLKEHDRDRVVDAIQTYLDLARSFSGEGFRSHRFLRGLFGYLELYHPDLISQIKQFWEPSSRIVTA